MTQDLRFFLITMKKGEITKEVWAKLDLEKRKFKASRINNPGN